ESELSRLGMLRIDKPVRFSRRQDGCTIRIAARRSLKKRSPNRSSADGRCVALHRTYPKRQRRWTVSLKLERKSENQSHGQTASKTALLFLGIQHVHKLHHTFLIGALTSSFRFASNDARGRLDRP